MGKPKKTLKKKNKKWIVTGYYIDDSGCWTLLESKCGYEHKRVKGIA